MTESNVVPTPKNAIAPVFDWFAAATEYAVDAAQRTILFWDRHAPAGQPISRAFRYPRLDLDQCK
jgi:hypothetical protein